MKTLAYAALNLNDDIRNKSSSGGIFYEIAKYVVLNDGVVYGARYDDHWLVVHDHTENIKDISSFLGSKYVQSNMNNQYEKIKIDLMSGRLVLFSGTPCQIRGLQCFLGKEYENLITVDFICHGVPSPKVWEKYINELSNGHNITKINFRDKSKGWQHFSLRIDFSDGNYYSKTQQEDLYMRGFLQDIYLRPSCYQCRFKGIERKSDLTLADYWGINNIYPELYDDKGTSLIFIHSKKGKNIFLKISNSLKKIELDVDDMVENKKIQPNAISSVNLTPKRENFYKNNVDNFDNLKNLTHISFIDRIFRKIKYILKHITRKK